MSSGGSPSARGTTRTRSGCWYRHTCPSYKWIYNVKSISCPSNAGKLRAYSESTKNKKERGKENKEQSIPANKAHKPSVTSRKVDALHKVTDRGVQRGALIDWSSEGGARAAEIGQWAEGNGSGVGLSLQIAKSAWISVRGRREDKLTYTSQHRPMDESSGEDRRREWQEELRNPHVRSWWQTERWKGCSL